MAPYSWIYKSQAGLRSRTKILWKHGSEGQLTQWPEEWGVDTIVRFLASLTRGETLYDPWLLRGRSEVILLVICGYTATLPILHIGEGLIFASRFAETFEEVDQIAIHCHFTGLEGRSLCQRRTNGTDLNTFLHGDHY